MVTADAALVESTIGIAALCAKCIVRIGDLDSDHLIDVLPRLIGSLRIASTLGRCHACLEHTIVHRRHRADMDEWSEGVGSVSIHGGRSGDPAPEHSPAHSDP
jgi:hypothetical protein